MSIETPNQILKVANSKLANSYKFVMRNESFFATLLLGLTKEAIEQGTMATDGKRFLYCPEFLVNECSQHKVTFITIHEVMHVVWKHHLRRGSRDPRLYNNAADYAINAYIVRMAIPKNKISDDKFKKASREDVLRWSKYWGKPEYQMPEDGLFDPKYYGMSSERIYDILKNDEDQKPKPGDDTVGGDGTEDGDNNGPGEGDKTDGAEDGGNSGGNQPQDDSNGGGDDKDTGSGDCPWGNFEDAVGEEGEALTPDELAEAEREVNQQIQTAAMQAKGRGQLPSFIEEILQDLRSPSQNWDEILEEMMAETIPNDFSFAKPNRMHLNAPIIMPSAERTGLGNVAIFTDASGSVSRGEFTQFMSDAFDICESLEPESVTLIQFDSRAGEPEILERGDEPELKRKCSGGTRFNAPFQKAEELGILEDFDVILLFTDGEDNTWPDEPDCPVFWCSTGAFPYGDPPFGQVVQVTFK